MSDAYSLIPLVLIVIIFYLLVMRPARTRQREFMATQQQLEAGREVMLASGIFGELVSVGEDSAELRIAPQTVITVKKQAVAKVIDPLTVQETLDGEQD